MKYLNRLLALALLAVVYTACNNDDDEEPHDPVQQAIIDDEILVAYLQSHYYNDETETIDTLESTSSPSLYDDSRMGIDDVLANEIDYKLYYFVLNEGVNDRPSTVDSVFTRYSGSLLDGDAFDANDNIWFTLGFTVNDVILGWTYGFTHFKSGDNISVPDEPLAFENTGQGYLFMPSGLAYGNNFVAGIPENSNLIFEIELKMVRYRDHDLDGTLSKDEDVNGNRNPTDDDTDGDGVPDYLDADNP
ncbi:FKBP-type peptidyl-prolyl cis-trans isomerase [Flavobacteriaceae bacterium]|nr:FKBP-type peptidyl-prolyl cis-trans isomerase [Flavobacteriaceae bacterium]